MAVVSFANGGDNIGIYTPLFSSQSVLELVATVAVFLILVARWCVLGYRLAHYPAVDRAMLRYGHLVVPFVMIGLGIYIILESATLALLGL